MKIILGGVWKLYIPHLNKTISATVPGSVLQDLLNEKIIPDPYYRTNEYTVREWMRYDYHYEKTFNYDDISKHVDLVCEGLDTIAEIYINDQLLTKTINMHLQYRFSLDEHIQKGQNKLCIIFKSPITYIEDKEKQCPYRFYQQGDAMRGFIHIRKAHSHFGWDWGPQLPDAGIFKDIYVHTYDQTYIEDVYLKQIHYQDHVDIRYSIKLINQAQVSVSCYDPSGNLIEEKDVIEGILTLHQPKLWWPVGYGDQPLYTILVKTKDDSKTLKIGLKQSTMKREQDQYGESFTYVHNGIEIFMRGANYIIEDNVVGRSNIEVSRRLLKDALSANHNTVRIWGGGIYPSDEFYALCDELGLLVWQDFMFACAFYNMDDQELLATIKEEIIFNAKRLYHHPSLALFCGNNENETAAVHWFIPSVDVSKKMYLLLFEDLIPTWLKELDLGIYYWPSSPSSGGKFKDPNSDNYGDMHYWGVWHLNEPIEYYRKHHPRFMSEFGIQSFPAIETVKTFAEEQDLHIYSKVMKSHQKNHTANSKIIRYMKAMFTRPKQFEHILYVSQLIQAEGVRYGVEHFRRHYGRTMGAIYWQLNDCWPVASWSSIDYYGRWKALHYHSKKFYAPVLLSIEEDKRRMTASIHVTNETLERLKGHLTYRLMTLTGEILERNLIEISMDKLSESKLGFFNFSRHKSLKQQIILHVTLHDLYGKLISENMAAFVQDKRLELKHSTISVTYHIEHKRVYITLISQDIKRFVELKYHDVILSDNYFHLIPNEPKTVFFDIEDESYKHEDLQLRSLVDIYEERS